MIGDEAGVVNGRVFGWGGDSGGVGWEEAGEDGGGPVAFAADAGAVEMWNLD